MLGTTAGKDEKYISALSLGADSGFVLKKRASRFPRRLFDILQALKHKDGREQGLRRRNKGADSSSAPDDYYL